MSNRGSEFLRLSVDLPRRDAEAAVRLIGGLNVAQNLSLELVRYDHRAALSPSSLFTMMEAPNTQRLFPAVLRAHLRHFESQDDTWVRKGLAERFINGLWMRGPSAVVAPKNEQWRSLSRDLILANVGRVAAIHAGGVAHVHELLATKQVALMGVGGATIDWLGEFNDALEIQLTEAS